MPDPTFADQQHASIGGAFAHLANLLGASAGYLKARLQLAGLETKEALVHYAIIIGLVIASMVVVLFGYFFFCFGLIFSIAALIDTRHAWIWVTFGFALLHFGAAAGALLLAKGRLAKPMFEATFDEFRKDQEWLTNEKPI